MDTTPSIGIGSTRRGTGPRIVMVHGFTQTKASWGRFADDLAVDHELVLLDAPGHGESATVMADLPAGAELLAAAGGPGTYLGYSMGGRFALHVALAHPELVDRLILVSSTAGIGDDAERELRRAADNALADRIEGIGVDAFLDEWLAQPMFASLGAEASAVDERKTNTAGGLASSLRLAGTGTQAPLWSRLGELDMPVLLIAGADDAKFADIAHRLAEAIGSNARTAVIEGAGHSAPLEDPTTAAAVVREWLSRR